MPRPILAIALWLGLVTFTPLAAFAEPAVISGVMRGKAGPLPGLALFERGGFYNNNWYRGVVVGPDGRFRIEAEKGGAYGLQLDASGYIYAPRQLYVRTGAGPSNPTSRSRRSRRGPTTP